MTGDMLKELTDEPAPRRLSRFSMRLPRPRAADTLSGTGERTLNRSDLTYPTGGPP